MSRSHAAALPPILDAARRRLFIGVCAAGFVQVGGATLAAFATRDVFLALGAGSGMAGRALAMLVLGTVSIALGRVASRTLAERLGQTYAVDVRETLYRHYAGMSPSALGQRRAGAVALRFVGDLGALRGWASTGLTRLATAMIVLPGAAFALWWLSPALAVAAVGPLFASLCGMSLAAHWIDRLHRDERAGRAGIAMAMMERVAKAPALDALGRTGRELRTLRRDGEMLVARATRRARQTAILRAIPDIGAGLAVVAVLAAAIGGGSTTAEAAAALAMLGIVVMPLRDLAGVRDKLGRYRVAAETCRRALSQPSRLRPRRRGDTPPAVRLDKLVVRSRFPDTAFAPRTVTAVIGGAGTGVSTLLATLAGDERPDAGAVRLHGDGSPPRTVFLGERSPILRGSLRRALAFGIDPRPDDATIEARAGEVGLDRVIERIGGLGGRIGEDGRDLSERERLRVLVVRALLARAPFLVVDLPALWYDRPAAEAIAALIKAVRPTVFLSAPASGCLSQATIPIDHVYALDPEPVPG